MCPEANLRAAVAVCRRGRHTFYTPSAGTCHRHDRASLDPPSLEAQAALCVLEQLVTEESEGRAETNRFLLRWLTEVSTGPAEVRDSWLLVLLVSR